MAARVSIEVSYLDALLDPSIGVEQTEAVVLLAQHHRGKRLRGVPGDQPRRRPGWPTALTAAVETALAQGQVPPPAGVSWATCAIVHEGGIETSPASACNSPRRSANRLDFPQPLGPIKPTLWPAWTVALAPSSRRLTPRASVRLEILIN